VAVPPTLEEARSDHLMMQLLMLCNWTVLRYAVAPVLLC
jgi:hypothetical protein